MEVIVLTVTEQAASMIRDLIDRADLPPGAGLRIAQRDDHSALAMNLAEEPDYHDMVLIEREVAVFLGPAAFRVVGSKTLDANITDTSAAFYLRD